MCQEADEKYSVECHFQTVEHIVGMGQFKMLSFSCTCNCLPVKHARAHVCTLILSYMV